MGLYKKLTVISEKPIEGVSDMIQVTLTIRLYR
jgi:hypothetical protein